MTQTVRVPDSVYDKAKNLAERRDVSISEAVSMLVDVAGIEGGRETGTELGQSVTEQDVASYIVGFMRHLAFEECDHAGHDELREAFGLVDETELEQPSDDAYPDGDSPWGQH